MSPEQASGQTKHLTIAADVYGLGAILYELLTGRPPFKGATPAETIRLVSETEAPRPSSINKSVDQDVETICLKCLDKDPQRRYASAVALAEDLDRWSAGEPILARPVSAREKLWRWCRRNKAAFAAVGSVAAALVIGLGLALWQSFEKTRAYRRLAGAEKNTRDEARRAKEALAEMQIQRAEDLFTANNSADAVAQLAHVLSRDRSNREAAERLLSALTLRSLILPVRALRHEGSVDSAFFTRNGRRLTTYAREGRREWETQSYEECAESPGSREVLILFGAISPDGRRVVTASSGRIQVSNYRPGGADIMPLARFSADGQRVLLVSSNSVQVWDVQTGELVKPLQHEDWVRSAQFSPNGLRVVTVSSNYARIWDAQTCQPLTEPLRHERGVSCAQFSSDGLRVLTGSWDGTARVWDAQTGEPLTDPLRHEGPIDSAQFSPDGLQVLTGSWDGTARVWDAQTGKPLTDPLRHGGRVASAQFSPDGLRVLTGSSDGTARVWNAQTGNLLTQTTLRGGTGHPGAYAQFSPDGLRVITVSSTYVLVWESQTAQPLTEPLRHLSSWNSANFSPNGLLVVAVSSNYVRVLDAQTGKPFTEPLRHEGMVRDAQFSPDGLRMITASDRTARVWDTQTGRPLTQPLKHRGDVYSVQFSPDGRRVVTVWNERVRPEPVRLGNREYTWTDVDYYSASRILLK